MRRVGGLVAVLLILGLAAAGFVSAQKGTTGSPPAAAVADLSAASTSKTAAATSQRIQVNPVSENFRAGTDGAPTHSAEPTRLAEATRAAPAAANMPAPNASAQSKPTTSAIPACDKPGGMGLARIVEADALPELIRQIKASSYKVVHMVPKDELITLPKYDEMVRQQDKLSSNNKRPENSVVRTIGE